MDSTELKTIIRDKLINELDVSHPVGPYMVVTRCPFCGDSKKDRKKGHFYVKLDTRNEDEPILYICHRCNESGILNPSVMRTLELNDLEVNGALISYNNKALKNSNKRLGITDNFYNFKVPMPNLENPLSYKKRDYINNRLGLNLSFEELVNLKTVFSLGQFLRVNEIERYTLKQERMTLLHTNYVGFLSTRNEFINFRNLYKDKNLRYDKYSILGGIDQSRKFYTIPNKIDLLTTKTINLNLAEGTFDIFGVYHHIMDREKENMIYASVNGSSYLSVIKYFIGMGVIGNVNINIFSDSGLDHNFYRYNLKSIAPWVNDVNVFHNTHYDENGKADYGVPANKIKLVKRKL